MTRPFNFHYGGDTPSLIRCALRASRHVSCAKQKNYERLASRITQTDRPPACKFTNADEKQSTLPGRILYMRPRYVYNVGVQSDQEEVIYSSLDSQEMSLSFKHYVIPYTMPLFGGASSEYTCVRKRCLSPRHSLRDVGDYFSTNFVTRHYSLTASVLHGLRKRVRELMVSDIRWLALWPWTIDHGRPYIHATLAIKLFILHALYTY